MEPLKMDSVSYGGDLMAPCKQPGDKPEFLEGKSFWT